MRYRLFTRDDRRSPRRLKTIAFALVALFFCPAALFAGVVRDTTVTPPYEIQKTSLGQDYIVWTGEFAEQRGTIGTPGQPDLPAIPIRLAVPINANARSVRVGFKKSVWQELAGVYDIAPVPIPVVPEDGAVVSGVMPGTTIEDGKDIDVYLTNADFPAVPVKALPMSQARKWKFVTIEFCPFRYNPVTGQLSVAGSVQVSVQYTTHRTTRNEKRLLRDKVFDDTLPFTLKNGNKARSWYKPRYLSAAGMITLQATGPANDYVIMTTAAIQNASTQLASFVAAKQGLGFNPLVVTESVWGGGTGNTAAENIRKWLKANYATLGIKYTLLIGNPNPSTGDVPMKMCWPRKYDTVYRESPTDYYYADLTGNWDRNGDGYYGDFIYDGGIGGWDLAPEVYVGRIPYYGVIADLDTILRKVVTYETDAGDLAWRKTGLIGASVTYYDKESGARREDGGAWGEALRSDVFAASGGNCTRLYEKAGVAPITLPCELPLIESNFVSEWNKGYGFAVWFGHGSTARGARHVWNSDDGDMIPESGEVSNYPIITAGDAAALSTSAASIEIGCACETARPEDANNLQYSLLRRGAVAAIGATRVSWSGSTWSAYCYDNKAYGYYIPKKMLMEKTSLAEADFWVRQTARDSCTFMNALDFNVYGDPSLKIGSNAMTIETQSMAGAAVGSPYGQTLSASGGKAPYAWGLVSGSLPSGLSLNASTGMVSGTPASAGVSSFTVQVVDSQVPSNKAAKGLSISVSASIAITTPSFPNGSVGALYSQTLTASGGTKPYSWSVTSGNLPAGLTLSASTGAISGTPTAAGTSSFTIRVADAGTPANTDAKPYSITVSVQPLLVTTTALSHARRGASYSQTLTAAGGIPPYAWSVISGSLPNGLTLNASTGVISGTPTTIGACSFTAQAADSQSPAGLAAKALSITVDPDLAVTTLSLASGRVGAAYSQTLAAAGGVAPYTWSVVSGVLPTGLALNSSTGVVSGTPAAAGTLSFTVRAIDSQTPGSAASQALSIAIRKGGKVR